MSNESLKSIQHLTRSKKLPENNEGVEKLVVLLSNTQITNEQMQNNHLPTICQFTLSVDHIRGLRSGMSHAREAFLFIER